MKKKLLLSLSALLMLVMSSCIQTPSWNQPTFYDSRLYGYWELVQINGYPTTGYDVNYMYFNGNGAGLYYYYDRGYRYDERLTYYCTKTGYSGGYNELVIQYQNSYNGPTAVDYYFSNSGNVLYMEWYDSYSRRNVIYTYSRINNFYW